MAKNLPGFADELAEVAAIERGAAGASTVVPPVKTLTTDALARIADYAATDTVSRLDWWAHPDRHFMRNDPQWSSVYANLLKAEHLA